MSATFYEVPRTRTPGREQATLARPGPKVTSLLGEAAHRNFNQCHIAILNPRLESTFKL
jgi:hypothetical protein